MDCSPSGPAVQWVAIPIGQGHSDLGRYAKDRGSHAMQLVGTETDEAGTNLAWSTVRVKITRTGDSKTLARFESTIEPGEGIHIPF